MSKMADNVTITSEEVSELLDYPGWSIVVENVYMVIVALLGIPGNLLCIAVHTKFMKSSTDYYVLTMAIFDLLCSAVNAPMFLIRNSEHLHRILNSIVFCMIHKLLIYMTSVSTSLLLAAVAVNRYLLTCKPSSTIHLKLNARVKEINIGIAVFSVVVCIWMIAYENYDYKTQTCESENSFFLYVLKSVVMMLFLVMFFAASVCYILVVLTVKRHHKKMERSRTGNFTSNDNKSDKHSKSEHKVNNPKRKRLCPSLQTTRVTPLSDRMLTSDSQPGTNDINDTKSSLTDDTRERNCYGVQDLERQSGPTSQDTIQNDSCNDTKYRRFETNKSKENGLSIAAQSERQPSYKTSPHKSLQNSSTHQANDELTQSTTTGIKSQSRKNIPNVTSAERQNIKHTPLGGFDSHILTTKSDTTLHVKSLQMESTIQALDKLSHVHRNEKAINKVTFMLFLVTLVYIITWLIHWVFGLVNDIESDFVKGVLRAFKFLFMINCVTNPVFYGLMSSKFRARVMTFVKRVY